MTLFDEEGRPVHSSVDEAALRRDDGMAAAEDHAPAGWNDQALDFIRAYAEGHEELFVDDLWEAGLEAPPNRRALGPVLMRAVRVGLIEKTGEYRASVRSHLSMKPVWKSRIYQGGNS